MTGFEDLGYALADTGRETRLGLPEVVYAPGKTVGQIVGVVTALLAANSGPVLVTRIDPDTADAVRAAIDGAAIDGAGPRYDRAGRVLCHRPAAPRGVRIALVTAGTADTPVADEAAAVATAVGLDVDRITDVGVAGVHRLLAHRDRLAAADVVVCVAGMEGALPSVVAGLVGAPVVAVPASTGYGAALEGVTALLAMLSSCAAGITVVNIDSGFGAAMAAFRLATRIRR